MQFEISSRTYGFIEVLYDLIIKNVQVGTDSALRTGSLACCLSTWANRDTTPLPSASGGASRRTRGTLLPGSSTEGSASAAMIHLQRTPSWIKASAIGSVVETIASYVVPCGE